MANTAPTTVRFTTCRWHKVHDSGVSVCELWGVYDSPASTVVRTREGQQKMAGPGEVRDYLGLCFDDGVAQIQVQGRLRVGGDRLHVELDPA